jgi:hypothetical protein
MMESLHRQLLALVYGLAVTTLALWALRHGGQSPTVIISVVTMSMLTLMLIFGVEIDRIQILDKIVIVFSDNGAETLSDTDTDTDDKQE